MPGAEAVEEQGENDEGDGHIGPVAFVDKSENSKDDAGHRRGDQEQESKLDDATEVTTECVVEDRRDVAQVAGLALKDPVMFR